MNNITILDFLIDENNKESDPYQDYYFRGPCMKNDRTFKYVSYEGLIVNNVKRMPNNSFRFTIKGETEEWYSNYGWAFIKYTPENMKKYKEYVELRNKIDKMEQELKDKFCEIEK